MVPEGVVWYVLFIFRLGAMSPPRGPRPRPSRAPGLSVPGSVLPPGPLPGPPLVPRALGRPVPATSARGRDPRSRSPRAVRGLADEELSRRIAKTCRYARCAFVIGSVLVCLDCRNYEELGLCPREVCDFLGHRCRWFLVPRLFFVVIPFCFFFLSELSVHLVAELGTAFEVDPVDVQRAVMAHLVNDGDSRLRFGIAWSQEGCVVQV